MPEHVGLYNTQRRIKLRYGDPYGIKIYSKPNIGTVVYIDFPKIEK